MAGGRFRFGIGRGLSRREYSHFRGIEMDESRDRFDEGSMMVKRALETGYIEGDGPYYPQPRTRHPAGAGAHVRRPPLRRRQLRRLDRGGGPAQGARW